MFSHTFGLFVMLFVNTFHTLIGDSMNSEFTDCVKQSQNSCHAIRVVPLIQYNVY